MFTANEATPRRKSQRRHRRNPIALARERHPVRIVAPSPAKPTPAVTWSDLATRNSDFDLDLATWEDAEWR